MLALILTLVPLVSLSAIIFSDYVGVFDDIHEEQHNSVHESKPDGLHYFEEDLTCQMDQSKQLFCHDIKDNSGY